MIKIFSKIASFFTNKDKNNLSAIILCAGDSTRFSGGEESKQMALIDGISVAERAIRTFDETKAVGEIIVVVRKEDAESYKSFIHEKGFSKVKCIVTGGETRQSSAMRGFKHIDENAKYVAIHDGARCLITSDKIENVLKEAIEYGAATAATKTTDTIKVADDEGFISRTIDRTYVWNVQTPQIFEVIKYKKALHKAITEQLVVTDDCMLFENAGYKVKLVETGADNIKITVKEDITRAEAILIQKGEIK